MVFTAQIGITPRGDCFYQFNGGFDKRCRHGHSLRQNYNIHGVGYKLKRKPPTTNLRCNFIHGQLK